MYSARSRSFTSTILSFICLLLPPSSSAQAFPFPVLSQYFRRHLAPLQTNFERRVLLAVFGFNRLSAYSIPRLCGLISTGYRYDSDKDEWKAVNVFPKWEELYPEPVDLVGVTRIYQPEIDKPVKRALQVRFVDSRRCATFSLHFRWDFCSFAREMKNATLTLTSAAF